jgi:LPXTG-motif cell wall-anchored protein
MEAILIGLIVVGVLLMAAGFLFGRKRPTSQFEEWVTDDSSEMESEPEPARADDDGNG